MNGKTTPPQNEGGKGLAMAEGGVPYKDDRGRRWAFGGFDLLFSFLTYDSFFFFFFISFFILMGRFGYSIGDKLFSRWVCSDRL